MVPESTGSVGVTMAPTSMAAQKGRSKSHQLSSPLASHISTMPGTRTVLSVRTWLRK